MSAQESELAQHPTTASIEDRRRRYRRQLAITAAVMSLVWIALVAFYVSNFGAHVSSDHEVWGQFGDYLGGLLNPVFGFAGFLILLNTLHEQRLQIEEERLQSVADASVRDRQLEEERQRFAEGYRARRLQSFEATFFQLLTRFGEVVGNFTYVYFDLSVLSNDGLIRGGRSIPINRVHGRAAINRMYSGLQREYKSKPRPEGIAAKDYYASLYKEYFKDDGPELGIYFRTLYHVFKFVDTSDLTLDERTRYANIARAQLSSYELALIFYNCLWGEGEAGFRPLVCKYGLLKHVKSDDLIEVGDATDRTLYPEEATANYTRRRQLWGGVEPLVRYD